MVSMTAKSSNNYDEATINDIVDAYTSSPARFTVDALAEKHNKSARSVIAKLSALGVYVKPAAVTKAGAPIVRKEEIVANIENAIGFELPTLVKASKADLDALNKYFLSK